MIVGRIRLHADNDVTGPVAEFVGFLSRQAGLTARQSYRLRLAVDEITTNVVLHGYRDGRRGVVDVEGGIEDDRVWVRIEDDAPPFDPKSHQPAIRTSEEAPNPPTEGGYGLFLAFSNVDEFAYDHVGGRNQNTLIMSRIAPGVGAGGTEGCNRDGRDTSIGRR
jgi:anti-sigma regulatory factor (Ser/Thr protein kinase)